MSTTASHRKEVKAQWKTEAEVPIVTVEEVAKHTSKGDNWIVIHGHAHDVTEYARDHPGGAEALTEIAGTDATGASEDVGQLTGKYFRHLQLGNTVEFSGPTAAMRYRKGMTIRIGVMAGGTGVTPTYRIIRAICEDPSDTTEASLGYANRSEQDILMRGQLDCFAEKSSRRLKVYYVVDKPTPGWKGGVGFVKKQIIKERLPGPAECLLLKLLQCVAR